MRARWAKTLAVLALGLTSTTAGSNALAHHPTAAPRQHQPHSIGGASEVALAAAATRFMAPETADQATLFQLSLDGALWLEPWVGLTLRLPVQTLRGPDEPGLGLGNSAIGAVFRGIYPRGFELLLSAELRLPTMHDRVGAHDGVAIVPGLVFARRGAVTPYVGASVLIDTSDEEPDMFVPMPLPPESSSELATFIGVSGVRARFDWRTEVRAVRPIGQDDPSLYVGGLLGVGVRIGDSTNVGSFVELPVTSDRLEWSAGLRVARSM